MKGIYQVSLYQQQQVRTKQESSLSSVPCTTQMLSGDSEFSFLVHGLESQFLISLSQKGLCVSHINWERNRESASEVGQQQQKGEACSLPSGTGEFPSFSASLYKAREALLAAQPILF